MDIYKEDVEVIIVEKTVPVSLKWLRGASRYNNGATIYGKKYLLRYILNNLKKDKYLQDSLIKKEDL